MIAEPAADNFLAAVAEEIQPRLVNVEEPPVGVKGLIAYGDSSWRSPEMFLGLPERLLRPLALGDVVEYDNEASLFPHYRQNRQPQLQRLRVKLKLSGWPVRAPAHRFRHNSG